MPGVAVGAGVSVFVGDGKGVDTMLIAGGSVNIGEGDNIAGDSIDGGWVAHAERLNRNIPSKHFCKVFFMGRDYSITMDVVFYEFLPDQIPGSLGHTADFFSLFSF
jgi:1,4-dihydroxy-2-naphthoyl-CoA synthase